MKLKKGYTHIYTGTGKGKTSASLGLALRAAGSGLKVCMFQFLKGGRAKTGESAIKLKNIKIVSFDEVHPLFKNPPFNDANREVLRKKISFDFRLAKNITLSKKYDVVILDEIINVVHQNFLDEAVLLKLIRTKPRNVELVLTGRGAGKHLLLHADYVTRFTKEKHPYEKGIRARKGIEF